MPLTKVQAGLLEATGTPSSTTFLSGDGAWSTPVVASLSTASGSAPSYSARAWVNFNGTGTVAIRASANVSSITDRNTGKYTVNFATAMPDANYGISTCVGPNNDTELAALTLILSDSPSASSVQVNNTFGINGSGSSFQDRAFCYVAIFR